jgi:hypothetical protein
VVAQSIFNASPFPFAPWRVTQLILATSSRRVIGANASWRPPFVLDVFQSRPQAVHGRGHALAVAEDGRACHQRSGSGSNDQGALDLAIRNQIDRFSLAIDVIDRVPRLQIAGAHAKERFRNMQIGCQNYAYEHGVDKPEIDHWVWP